MKNNVLFTFLVFAFAATLFGCHKTDTTTKELTTTIGEKQPFGSDSIRTWVKTDANGLPTSIGVTFKALALPALPATDTMIMLMLPAMPGISTMMVMPFDHVEIDWAPHGDPAPSVYNVAHLDCHFYTSSMSYQMGIMAGHDSVALNAQYVPKDCKADGDAEAGMGVHWMDTTAHEFHGMPFDHTYDYGFYHGDMIFIEAMCAKSFLDAKTNFTGTIKQPAAFKKSGYYPLNYSISYDAVAKEYTYSLDNLKSH